MFILRRITRLGRTVQFALVAVAAIAIGSATVTSAYTGRFPIGSLRRKTARVLSSTIAGAALLLLAVPVQAATAVPPPPGTWFTAPTAPGADQTDPHVSGDLVTYTQAAGSSSVIHYLNVSTAVDSTIPNGGGFDFLSAVDSGRIVFSRSTPGTNGAIYLFDTGTGSQTPLAPAFATARDWAAIGGATVAWQDRTTNPNAQLVAYDLGTGTATQLSSDPTRSNLTPSISSDGSVVSWVSCAPPSDNGCEIWTATRGPAGWISKRLTTAVPGTPGDTFPSTNGQIVIYTRGAIGNGSAIFYQPVAGGSEQTITMPASLGQVSPAIPRISGNLVSFDLYDQSGGASVQVADLQAGTVYKVSPPPDPRAFSLSDISLASNGVTTVAWQVFGGNGAYAVGGYRYHWSPPDSIPPTTTATPVPGPASKGLGITVHVTSATVTPGGSLGTVTCFNTAGLGVDLSAVDEPGGTGVKQITYAMSGAQAQTPTSVAGSTASVQITANGTTILTYEATDGAGNVEAQKALTVFVSKSLRVACAGTPTSVTVPPHGTITVAGTVTFTNPWTGQSTTFPFNVTFTF